MILLELFTDFPDAYHTPKDDSSSLNFSDTRKTKLTLAQINRLRKINDIRIIEKEKELAFVRKMYSTPAEDSGGF